MFERIHIFCFVLLLFFHKGMHNFQEVIKFQNIYCGLLNNVIIIFLENVFLILPVLVAVSCNFDNQIMLLAKKIWNHEANFDSLYHELFLPRSKVNEAAFSINKRKKFLLWRKWRKVQKTLCTLYELSASTIGFVTWKLIQRKFTSKENCRGNCLQ